MTTDITSVPEQAEEAIRARADLITALVLVGLGLVIVYFSWTMDRLEVRRINPATIPGLVPLLLGGALTVLGAMLAVRSARLVAPGSGTALARVFVSWPVVRIGTVLALALFYTLVLVGRMPFWLASGLFIFAFIVLFETILADRPKPLLPTLLWALGIAIAGGGGIFWVFARIFLVRLP